jgi:D-3-phosphoglycerate dehydrogenase
MKNVFLTGPIHDDAANLLAEHAKVVVAADSSPATLIQGVVNADAVIVRHQLPAGVFSEATKLRGVVRHGAGVDMIPVEEASRCGIVVANVPGINADYVAEYAVGQMIALARRFGAIQSAFRDASWDHGKAVALGGIQLRGKTLGIIGLGAIGRRVAQIARDGFGMRPVAARRGEAEHAPSDVERLPFDELLSVADFIVVSCPLTPETERLLDRAAFSKMKPSAYLVNVARGKCVDTEALIHALENKLIAGAALDVYEETPLPRTSILFDYPNIVLTPHVAAMTGDSMKKMAWESALQVVDILQGRYPTHWVNEDAKKTILARWERISRPS